MYYVDMLLLCRGQPEAYSHAVVKHYTCILYNMNCICEVCSELCMINDTYMYTIAALIYPGVSHTPVSFSSSSQAFLPIHHCIVMCYKHQSTTLVILHVSRACMVSYQLLNKYTL